MIRWSLGQIAATLEARTHAADPRMCIRGVAVDSRDVRGGELFFALPGTTCDGHRFVTQALRAGAVAAVVAAAHVEAIQRDLSRAALLVVDDTLAALQQLAAAYRQTLAARVVAVVGSNGKTTTKAMIDHVLAGALTGTASPGSFNNHVGVPRTLLAARQDDQYLIAEIGTNTRGEVAALARLVRPDIAVVTCIAEEHLEGLGDLAGVLDEETSVFDAMAPGGVAIVRTEPIELRERAARRGLRVVTFADADSDLPVRDVRIDGTTLRCTIGDCAAFCLPAPVVHNAHNAAAAVAVAGRFGIPAAVVARRLRDFRPPAMRMQVLCRDGLTLLHDAYNANPASTRAALDALAAMPATGRRIAVLGTMCELGEHAPRLHEQVARHLAARGFDAVIVVGQAGRWMHPTLQGAGLPHACVEDARQAGARLAAMVRPGDVVLLKASRAVGLERALEVLDQARAATPGAGCGETT